MWGAWSRSEQCGGRSTGATILFEGGTGLPGGVENLEQGRKDQAAVSTEGWSVMEAPTRWRCVCCLGDGCVRAAQGSSTRVGTRACQGEQDGGTVHGSVARAWKQERHPKQCAARSDE